MPDDTPLAPGPPPGWYSDPHAPGMRWWDGGAWGPALPNAATETPPMSGGKSAGSALLFTLLWPGAGHLYLGLDKGKRAAIANAVGLVLFFAGAFPLTVLIWLVTVIQTLGTIVQDTRQVNRANGVPIPTSEP